MANVMNFQSVENVVNNYAANHAATKWGHNIVCVVSLKRERVRASGAHLIGHVAKCTMVNHCAFPRYDKKVAAITGMPIVPKPLNGMHWVNYPYIKQSNKSGFRFLNIYYGLTDVRIEFTNKWLVDGKLATPQEVAEIERHLVPKNNNRDVKCAMYQIDVVNDWDGFLYFGESKEKAIEIFEKVGQ